MWESWAALRLLGFPFHRLDANRGNARLPIQLDVSQFNMIVTIRFFYGWNVGSFSKDRHDWNARK